MRYDEESKFYNAGVRYYRPDIGRFFTQDLHRGTRSLPDTLNRYQYALNNPVNEIDHLGYGCCKNAFKTPKRFKNLKLKDITLKVALDIIVHYGSLGNVTGKDVEIFIERNKTEIVTAVVVVGVVAVVALSGPAGLAIVQGMGWGALYGAGYGAAIGGGYALLSGGSAEDVINGAVRGAVIGAVVGAAIGGMTAGINYYAMGPFQAPLAGGFSAGFSASGFGAAALGAFLGITSSCLKGDEIGSQENSDAAVAGGTWGTGTAGYDFQTYTWIKDLAEDVSTLGGLYTGFVDGDEKCSQYLSDRTGITKNRLKF